MKLIINNRYRLRDGTRAIVLRGVKLRGAHRTQEDAMQGRDEENGIDLFWDLDGHAAGGGQHPKDCVKDITKPKKAAIAGAAKFSASDKQLVGFVPAKARKRKK